MRNQSQWWSQEWSPDLLPCYPVCELYFHFLPLVSYIATINSIASVSMRAVCCVSLAIWYWLYLSLHFMSSPLHIIPQWSKKSTYSLNNNSLYVPPAPPHSAPCPWECFNCHFSISSCSSVRCSTKKPCAFVHQVLANHTGIMLQWCMSL